MRLDTWVSRRAFFARLRKEGFERAPMDLTKGATTYRRGRCMVAIGSGENPDAVIITGGPPEWPKILRWHDLAPTALELGLVSLLDLTLALSRGQVEIRREPV